VTQLAPDWAERLRERIAAPVGVRERFWPPRKWVQEQMLRECRLLIWRVETGEDWYVWVHPQQAVCFALLQEEEASMVR
jgi:hypothetical protein